MESLKVFKHFLSVPTAIDDEGASVQCAREEVADGKHLVYLQWIRQFAAVEAGQDIPVRYVTVELADHPEDVPLDSPIEIWSYDFPALPDFAAHVEGLAVFQHALNAVPLVTEPISGEV